MPTMISLAETPHAESLRLRYEALLADKPSFRIRDAADTLEVSEAELLALGCGSSVTRLEVSDWVAFVSGLKALGRVMVLTRNAHCVHEKTGHYENIAAHGGRVGLITGKDIDLRLFYGEWALAFAVESAGHGDQSLRSIQFFDAHGDAIHKVYVKSDEGRAVWEQIAQAHRSDNQSPEQAVSSRGTARESGQALTELGRASFLSEWKELKDTHDFFILLKNHRVSRIGAMEAAEGMFTQKVSNDSARRLLEIASAEQVPIMVFTGNEGAIQIHTGPVKKIVPHGEWINVLDPDFNLHLQEPGIVSSWIVEKPTTDGTVHSLELYNAEGGCIVQFFGERKPGKPERGDWRELVTKLRS